MLHSLSGLRLALPLLLIVWLLSASMVWGTGDTVTWQNSSALESSDSQISSSEDGDEAKASTVHRLAFQAPASPAPPSHRSWCLLQPGHGGPAARAPPVPLHV